ncbi:MAG: sensor histidine kinase, partial [Actinomycetota bacterium]
MRLRSLVAQGLFVLWVSMQGLSLVIDHINGAESFLSILVVLIAFMAFAVVGTLLISRTQNPIGPLFMGVALGTGLANLLQNLGDYGLDNPGSIPGTLVVYLLGSAIWFSSFTFLVLALLLFPSGRLKSRRWRPVAWTAVVGGASEVASYLIRPGPMGDLGKGPINPIGIQGAGMVAEILSSMVILVGVGAIAGIASVIMRFRGSKGEERQQYKWVAYAAGMVGAILVILISLSSFMPDWVQNSLFGLALLAVPAATGFAVLKYRLYEIDVIINKTVVYGALAAFITLVYVGVVVGIGTLVGAGDKPNLALSLAATAIVAVAFQPVRERVQRFANKLVYGERVTPYEAITGFSHRMAESLSLDAVLPQMAEAAAKGVGGVRSRVKLILPGGGEQMADWPGDSPGDSPDNSFDRTLAVVHQGEQMGEISVSKSPGEQINKNEDKLLSDLASQAGLAMRNLRLTAELQQKLIELQASRQRIVKAQDEERRRMERDIHDGAQQQLVSMSVKLGLVGNLLGRDVDKAGAILQELRGEASEAVETLRDLARGLFPEILTEQGLKSALLSHIAKMNLNAKVEGEIGRFDLEVEANVYFCVREALQNASKHAPAAEVLITLSAQDDHLAFSVKDAGPGFDVRRIRMGSGLQNMADRVEALG